MMMISYLHVGDALPWAIQYFIPILNLASEHWPRNGFDGWMLVGNILGHDRPHVKHYSPSPVTGLRVLMPKWY
jgi:hypothetical protein